jgi:hypothetical protein
MEYTHLEWQANRRYARVRIYLLSHWSFPPA